LLNLLVAFKKEIESCEQRLGERDTRTPLGAARKSDVT
jgi:hypothetical protein